MEWTIIFLTIAIFQIGLICMLLAMHLFVLKNWIDTVWHPFTWVSLYFFYQTTLRAILHAFNLVEPLAHFGYDYAYIHIYASCFHLLLGFCSLQITKKIPILFKKKQGKVVEECEYWLFALLFVAYVLSWIYMYRNGGFATLGENRIQQYSYFLTIANFVNGFAPFLVCLSGLLMLRDRSVIMFFFFSLMILFTIIPSFVGGGRAALLGAFMMLGLLLIRTRGSLKYITIFAALLAVIFSGLVLTLLRGNHFYQKKQTTEDVKYAFLDQISDLPYDIEDAFLIGLDRFSYYSDTWVILKRKRWNDEGGVPRGTYPLGSLTDLYMFVPRPLWPGKPYDRFNYWMAYVILGKNHELDYPIGRIGEAYYIADFTGVLFAPIYAFIFVSLIYRNLYFSSHIVGISFYFYFLFRYIINGSGNFLAFVDVTVKSSILIYLIYLALRAVFHKSFLTQRTF